MENIERRDFMKKIGLLWVWAILNPDLIFAKFEENSIEKSKKQINDSIMITIDDWPSKYSVAIAWELDRLWIKWTFFFIGENIAEFKNEVIEILNRWHKVWNHSFTHPQFNKITLNKAKLEVEKSDKLIRDIISKSNQDPNQEMYFRYPYWAEISNSMKKNFEEFLSELKLQKLSWDVDTNDWRSRVSESRVKKDILSAKNQQIVLVHDKIKTFNALKSI